MPSRSKWPAQWRHLSGAGLARGRSQIAPAHVLSQSGLKCRSAPLPRSLLLLLPRIWTASGRFATCLRRRQEPDAHHYQHIFTTVNPG